MSPKTLLAVVMAILTLAHQLDIRVVAEGVETESQERFLRDHACDVVQGFLFGKPMSADQIEQQFLLGQAASG